MSSSRFASFVGNMGEQLNHGSDSDSNLDLDLAWDDESGDCEYERGSAGTHAHSAVPLGGISNATAWEPEAQDEDEEAVSIADIVHVDW